MFSKLFECHNLRKRSFHKKSGKVGILERLKWGEFLVSVQLDSPGARDISEFRNAVCKLIKVGVRIVDINSSRRISHDSIQLAAAMRRLGLEVIPHVTTRDSLTKGLLNQILAACAWDDVHNFLIVTGDPYEASQSAPSGGVFEADSIGALEAFDKYLRKNPEYCLDTALAAAVNQNEKDLEKEGERIKKKCLAGADFFMSQPVFTKKQVFDLFDFYRKYSEKPLLVGIWPLLNAKTFEAICNNRVVGVVMPDEVYEEASTYLNKESSLQKWETKRALELIEYVSESGEAEGIYIVAPSRNPLLLTELLQEIKMYL